MPDGKITRQKIRDHLRRLWPAYLIGLAVLVFLNNLVYTVTRPGYSEDETLKIMLLNVEAAIPEEALLQQVEHLGFKCVETLPLSLSDENPGDAMLLAVQLTGGYGDIFIADAACLNALLQREACLPLPAGSYTDAQVKMHTAPEAGESYAAALRGPNDTYFAVMRNGTTPENALAAMDILFQMITE